MAVVFVCVCFDDLLVHGFCLCFSFTFFSLSLSLSARSWLSLVLSVVCAVDTM